VTGLARVTWKARNTAAKLVYVYRRLPQKRRVLFEVSYSLSYHCQAFSYGKLEP